jgi:hypothetical protein
MLSINVGSGRSYQALGCRPVACRVAVRRRGTLHRKPWRRVLVLSDRQGLSGLGETWAVPWRGLAAHQSWYTMRDLMNVMFRHPWDVDQRVGPLQAAQMSSRQWILYGQMRNTETAYLLT